MTVPTDTTAAVLARAPLGRLLFAELRWVLRRPRTLIMLGVLTLVPVVVAVGVAVSGGPRGEGARGEGPALVATVIGNGLVLPVVALWILLALLLPLAVAMVAADAIAGESAHGTLRGLLVAPVGRTRLVVMKAFGVLTVTVVAVALIAIVSHVAGLVVVGGAEGTLVTLSGTTLGYDEAVARAALVAIWTVGQLLAVGAVALAVSSVTEHPLVVVVVILGGIVAFGVLAAVPSFAWLEPMLLTSGWDAGIDAMRDPLPLEGMASSTWRALVYVVLGLGLTVWRMRYRSA
ncbi:MAG: ABC transporter permease subunit [Actinomycetota bacterium]|nr:ABC transporter permease subunit [Actinomycetota bacterium]